MSQENQDNNRAVWFDIPVKDLGRACDFYAEVLDIKVAQENFDGFAFGVLDHDKGNGGCLIPNADEITEKSGVLLYLNVAGRIQDAVKKVEAGGGKVIQATHNIGPHGFRAVILDSEGNRMALHSMTDE